MLGLLRVHVFYVYSTVLHMIINFAAVQCSGPNSIHSTHLIRIRWVAHHTVLISFVNIP